MRALAEVPGCSGRRCCRHICPESSELVAAEPPRPIGFHPPRAVPDAAPPAGHGRSGGPRLSGQVGWAGWALRWWALARKAVQGQGEREGAATKWRLGGGGGVGAEEGGTDKMATGSAPRGWWSWGWGAWTSGWFGPGRGPVRGAVAAEAGNKMAAAKGESRGGQGSRPRLGAPDKETPLPLFVPLTGAAWSDSVRPWPCLPSARTLRSSAVWGWGRLAADNAQCRALQKVGARLSRPLGRRCWGEACSPYWVPGEGARAFLSPPLPTVGDSAAPGKPRESELSPRRDRVHDS